MLLGKRPRPPMKRTTSMTEITLDLDLCIGDAQPPPHQQQHQHQHQQPPSSGGGQLDQRFLAATVSPRNHRRNSTDFVETPHFLRACFLCKRRLVPGRDIYMYRGDSAFCSLECRQQQMSIDERKEKCSSATSKKEAVPVAPAASGSAKAETVAAV